MPMLDDIKQLLAQGEAEEALRLLRPLAAQQPRSAEVQLCLSEAYFQLGAGARAAAAAREAVRLGRRDPAAHYQLGRLLSAQGQWDQAERTLQQALKLAPGYGPAQAELDRVRQVLGKGGTPTPVSTRKRGESLPTMPAPSPREARPAGSRRPWALALMSAFVLVCCAAIVFATLQPRWTGWHKQREPKPQVTQKPLPPTPQAQPQALPTPAAPQGQAPLAQPPQTPATQAPAAPTVQPEATSPPMQVAQAPSPSQGTDGPKSDQGPRPTAAGQNVGQPGEGNGGRGGMLVACPLCGSSGWMLCPYCLISGDPKCQMCGGRKQVECWLCGGKGQALWKNGEYYDTVGDHMPTETIPNEAIRQAVEQFRETGKIPPELKGKVEDFLKQSMKGGGKPP